MTVFFYEGDDGEQYSYEPAQQDLDKALAKIIAEQYFADYVPDFLQERMVKQIYEFVSDLSVSAGYELEDDYHDELEDFFRGEAMETRMNSLRGED